MPRATTSSIPIDVQRASWEDLWDELLCLSVEDAPPVEEARREETDRGQALLHQEADEAA